MKIKLLAAAVVMAALTSSAWAQAPGECFRLYPGAKGKSCCNSSYGRVGFGGMSTSARIAELNACTGRSVSEAAGEAARKRVRAQQKNEGGGGQRCSRSHMARYGVCIPPKS